MGRTALAGLRGPVRERVLRAACVLVTGSSAALRRLTCRGVAGWRGLDTLAGARYSTTELSVATRPPNSASLLDHRIGVALDHRPHDFVGRVAKALWRLSVSSPLRRRVPIRSLAL